MYYAHSVEGRDSEAWQPLAAHLRTVADLAGQRAARFGIAKAGVFAGLLHDLGKYTAEFRARLRGGIAVDHATAGAQMAVEQAGVANGLMGQIRRPLRG